MSNQESAGGIKFLCLFIPLLGLILYLVWKDEKPVAATECGKFAIYGVIGWVIYTIVSFVIGGMMMFDAFNTINSY
ncbi:uncharacterized protein METZ01_LOCUS341522 [marine metagenome]|uniref:Uncharacterized protein n=1 Tax=marine metagenome TaxID=408172 RepID=A0A382QUT6_9ZZZZ|tara:strand:+ start:126 stop:353 length:228 start_codon:yes stop_codon:yes gene_type:complete